MSATAVRPRPRRLAGRTPAGRWLQSWLARPMTSLHLLLGVFGLLTGMGLVMVLSASSARAAAGPTGSAFSLFQRHVLFVSLGAVLFYLGLRTPLRVIRRLGLPAVLVSVVLLGLVLVPGIGSSVNGSRSWFVVGSLSLQPSEAAKVAVAVWGAHLLATRRPHLAPLRHLLVPLLPVVTLLALLILLQPDLGTTITLAVIVAALLWFGGMSIRLFVLLTGLAGAGALAFALTVGPRSARISSWLNPNANLQSTGYQALQARYSLADGGWWGVGLGQSRAKWNYLPNAHNDFIFAIIGEELGFIGCAVVLGLFALLACVGLRIAARSVDPFQILLAATCTVWMVGQAFLNVGYVSALLPVTGLQLPMISAGGTSTALTMLVFGLLANVARHEPPAIAALRTGEDGILARWLRLPAPQPYVPQPFIQRRAVRPPTAPVPGGRPARPAVRPARPQPPRAGSTQPSRSQPARSQTERHPPVTGRTRTRSAGPSGRAHPGGRR